MANGSGDSGGGGKSAAAAEAAKPSAQAGATRNSTAPITLMPPPAEPPPPPLSNEPPPPPPPSAPAHHRYRTDDVADDGSTFADLMLPQPLVGALAAAGFARPSPVQRASIPLGLVGHDLIVQAKSGTGKTCAFCVIALRRVDATVPLPQALIVAPTREVALQSCDVAQRIAAALPAPAPVAAAFVGGLPTADDQKRLRRTCHIVVGTPGRLCALAASGALPLANMRVLVLDEADALLRRAAVGSPRDDVLWLARQLPGGGGGGGAAANGAAANGGGGANGRAGADGDGQHNKSSSTSRKQAGSRGSSSGGNGAQQRRRAQVLAFSATFDADLLADLGPLMDRPRRVLLCGDGVGLRGVRQFYALVDDCKGDEGAGSGDEGEGEGEGDSSSGGSSAPPDKAAAAEAAALRRVLALKCDALLRLLSGAASLRQAVVFCNRKPAAEWLARRLTAAGFPAAYVAADVAQAGRNAAMDAVRRFQVRAVVATDVLARGVDLERANLVALLDLPPDAATYVHRVGRTGRFGTRGVAVAFVTGAELPVLREYAAAATSKEGGGSDVGSGSGSGSGAPLEPLPDPLPPSLYAFELAAGWERDAAARLAAAPVLPAPPGGPPLSRRRQDEEQAQQQEEEEEDGGAGNGDEQYHQQQQQHGEWEAWAAWDAWRQWRAWQDYYAATGAAAAATEDRGEGEDAGSRDGGSDAGSDDGEPFTPRAAAIASRLVVSAALRRGGSGSDGSRSREEEEGQEEDDTASPQPQQAGGGGGRQGQEGGGCWACAYSEWRREYAEWAARYDAWRRALADPPPPAQWPP